MQYTPGPLIPGSSNTSSSRSNVIQTLSLQVQNRASFFGVNSIGQQTVYPTTNSIVQCLQRLGLAEDAYYQEGSKLVGSSNSGHSLQGWSIAVSGDGLTLAVGGIGDNAVIGATWIFKKIQGSWTQQGSKLVGTGTSGSFVYQGCSVSLSYDGTTLAVGGSEDDSSIGATWIFTVDTTTGVWSQQGSKLVGTGYVGGCNQGISVSLSDDGSTLAVGGYSDNSYVGATWIFSRSGSTWTQVGSKLVGTGYVGANVCQGISVSLSGDGSTLAVGGSYDNNAIGATWIFKSINGSWTQVGSKLVGTGYVGTDIEQGTSVSLKGNTLAVGGYYDNAGIGAVWIFKYANGSWTQYGSKLVDPNSVGDVEQGILVSLSGNGSTLVYSSNTGGIWIYKYTNGSWTQFGDKILKGPSGSLLSICVSYDGYTIVVGSNASDATVGASWVFVG